MQLTVEQWPVAKLKPYARNPRKNDHAVDRMVVAIKEFGFRVPIVANSDGSVVGGHLRLKAALSMGLTTVPVALADDLTPDQIKAFRLSVNKSATWAEWDEALLRIELAELKAEAFDISTIGFDDAEIADIFADRTAGLTDPDDAPAVEAVVVSKPGDLWLLGNHRLLCGDCTDAATVARAMGDAKPHLMVTDPPYGVEYDPAWRRRVGINEGKGKQGKVANDHRADWTDAWRLLNGDVVYIWHADVHAAEVARSIEAAGFTVRSQIIWAKDRMVLSRGHYHWQHEPCWYAVRDGATGHWSGDRSQTTLWTIPAREDSGHGHGTQKPVECMKRPIENNSRAGDSVYDPFVGSGTTIIAAEMTGRRCVALEVAPQYCDVAVRRWMQFTGQRATLEATGEPFDEAREDAIDVAIANKRLAEIDAA